MDSLSRLPSLAVSPAPALPQPDPKRLVPPNASFDRGGSRESLSQRAYNQICRSLASSALGPGHRLILRPLATSLNLSPTPVREALLRLVSEQALALDERGSAIVPVMTQAALRELTDMRGDLEARVAERAVEFATDAQIDEIEHADSACMAAYARHEHAAMFEANVMVHRAVCRAGQAPIILRALEGLWMRIGPIYALGLDRPLPQLAPGCHPHRQLIEALRRRDPAAARAAALLDVCESSKLLEPRLAAS